MADCQPHTPSSSSSSRRRRSWFTPGKEPVAYKLAVQSVSPEPDVSMDEMEILTLSHFTRPPKVDFGTLRPGKSALQHILVENPHDYEQTVVIEKFPYKRNFSLTDTEFTVDPEGRLTLSIEWNPTEIRNYRETVIFKVDGVYRLQATLMGKLEEPPKPKKVRRTWARKPALPVHGVLRSSNKGNCLSVQAPAGKSKSRLSPGKSGHKVTKEGVVKLKTPPRKAKKASGPLSNDPTLATYINPQVPLNASAILFEKRATSPGPINSPLEPRRTTFEKSSPEMHNTPVISVKTPPQSMRDKLLKPRCIMNKKSPSPLAAVRENEENLPPMSFCEESSSPPNVRVKSKMRRSNTYTKLNDLSFSPELANNQSPIDSGASDMDTTVIEKTEVTECIEVTEVIECTEVTEYTEVCEEVVDLVETIDYIVEGDPNQGGTYTEVGRSVKPIGRQVHTVHQSESNNTYQKAFNATRVITHHDLSTINESRLSVAAPPHSATFVKSPCAVTPGILSETQVLSPRAARMSDMRESFPLPVNQVMSQTRVLTPTPASPRRFFSDLLALHEGDPGNKQETHTLPNIRRTDQSAFTREEMKKPMDNVITNSSSVNQTERSTINSEDSGFVLHNAHIENEEFEVNPRRISSLTVTKDRQSNRFLQMENDINPRRVSSVTVTKNPQQPSPVASAREGRCLFSATSPQSALRQTTPDSPGVRPLTHSPSPVRKTPTKIHIYGTNYPNSRSPRKLDEEDWCRTPSPQKTMPRGEQITPRREQTTPRREQTRRRTSGQFRRRSATYQGNGSLLARGVTPKVNRDGYESDAKEDGPMTTAELYDSPEDVQVVELPSREPSPSLAWNRRAVKLDGPLPKKHTKPEICGPRRERALGASSVEGGHQSRKLVEAKTARPLPNYLRPTSAVQRRKEEVAESKKRDLSAGKPRPGKVVPTSARQEPASKRVRREVTSQVTSGLTKTQALRREAALTSMGKTEKKTAPKPKPKISQGKLRLIRATTKTALPKHPMAFVAKNIYYDERWMEKEERGFVRWLNFVLTPHEEECSGASKPKKGEKTYEKASNDPVDAGALSACTQQSGPQLAPTRETLSFRVYSARRRLNRLRRQACRLFTSDNMVRFHHKLEVEVECQRIVVRPDRMIHADVGIRQCILDLLLSYNPLWLRIGLETVYGEVLPITSNDDVLGMSRFILTRLLANPDIAVEFAHPSVPHLYREGYDKRLAQFTLKNFLLLVVFLDLAKTSRLIDHDPCLFCRDADHKASRDLLLIFSRDYLSGEGDLSRHLGYLGYAVSHVQTPLDELDYAVTNLATDLRDGTRLTRVVALLTERWTLTKELRVPAISRLQKVYNIGISFRVLQEMGLELHTIRGGKVTERDICDGHREKTLQLLWQIIFKFQVDLLLNEEQLRDEVRFLQANLVIQKKLDAALNDDIEALGIPEDRRQSLDTDIYVKSPRLGLLLKWCRSVCAYYGLKVENFTVSFSDGRALCLLVHHYHPGLLPLSDIKQETTQTVGPGDHNTSVGSESDDSFTGVWPTTFGTTMDKPIWDELLANERENYRVLYDRVNELGNVPVMVRSTDMSNTIPDEKVVITYVTYLCARLLDIRHETRAARIIQVAWRKYKLKKQELILKVRYEAAGKIQRVVRSFLNRRRYEKRMEAAVKIQAAFRGLLARRKVAGMWLERQMANKKSAIITIQAYIRSWLVRRQRKEQVLAAVQVQSWWRMTQYQRAFSCQRNAAVTIQQWYRAQQAAQYQREHYLSLRSAAVCIQAHLRRWLVQKSLSQQEIAAIRVQSWWRMVRCQLSYMTQREAAIIIQHQFRACVIAQQQRAQYLQLKTASLVLQRVFRAKKARIALKEHGAAETIQKSWKVFIAARRYQQAKCAALRIQNWYRAKQQRQCYIQLRSAAICIQAFARSWRTRRLYKLQISSAITIQSYWRMYSVQKAFLKKQGAAVVIQQNFRAWGLAKKERERFVAMKAAAVTIQKAFVARKTRKAIQKESAAITLQSHWKSYKARKAYHEVKSAVIKIQSCIRARQERRKYKRMQRAAVCIQKHVRACGLAKKERERFLAMKAAAVTIQKAFIARKTRKAIQRESAAITLQSHWKSYKARKAYREVKSAVIKIQSCIRARQERRKYKRMQRAAVCIQKHIRACGLAKKERERFLAMKAAAVTIQRAFIARKTRKAIQKESAAITLQSHWKSYKARKAYHEVKSAVIKIQSCIRARQERRKYKRMQRAAVCIQKHVRACGLAKKERERFLAMKAAAVTIQKAFIARKTRKAIQRESAAITLQSHWKSYKARKAYREVKSAVIKIQSCIRARQERRKYKRMQRAAVCIQKHIRACGLAKKERERFLAMKAAAVTIQRAFIARKTRKAIQKESAAITLQSHWKSYKARKAYHEVKSAVIKIQSYIRARQERRKYKRMQRAAVCIQKHVRSWQVQQAMRSQSRAALKIQSWWHMVKVQRIYVIQRAAAITVQEHYRAYRLAKQQRVLYLAHKTAATTIQSHWRSYVVGRSYHEKKIAVHTLQRWYRARRQRISYCRLLEAAVFLQSHIRAWSVRHALRKQTSSAIRIQSWFRMKTAQCSYSKKRDAVIVIQNYLCAWRASKLCRTRYLTLRAATTTLQRAFRARSARIVEHQNRAATSIQKYWRSYATAQRYQKTRSAILLLQRWFRARKQRAYFSELREAAICVQAHVRSWLVRREQRKRFAAALELQKWWRMITKRQVFCEQRQAVMTIQSHVHAWLVGRDARQKYISTRRAVIALQAGFRGRQQRQKYLTKRKATSKIQAAWRAHAQQTAYRRLRQAVLVLQTRYRAMVTARTTANVYQAKRRAAVILQAAWRSVHLRREYLRVKQAAVLLQSHTRRLLTQSKFQVKKKAVVHIQRWYRACKRGQQERREFYILLGAVITLQAGVRGWQVRRWVRVIHKLKQSAVVIQSHVRRYQAQKRYHQQRQAAIAIQRFYRHRIEGKRQYYNYHITRGACIIIQTQVRGWLKRRYFSRLQQAAVTIQSHYRGKIQRQQYRQLKQQHSAATQIQAAVRGYQQRREHLRLKAAVVVVQHYYRAQLSKRYHRYQFLLQKGAAITLQAAIRGFLVRQKVHTQRQACVAIQTAYRSFVARQRYVRMKAAAVIIQSFYRGYCLQKQEQNQLQICKKAATTIQSAFRGFVVRKRSEKRHQSATVIQAVWQSHRARRKFIRLKAAAMVLQTHYRSHLLRRRQRRMFLIKKGAAITIQSAVKGLLARRRLTERRTAVTVIQSAYRTYVVRREFLQMRRAATVIQVHYRAYLLKREAREVYRLHRRAARVIQAVVRGFVLRRELKRQHQAAVTIQSTVKGWLARKQFLEKKSAVINIQRRWQQRLEVTKAVGAFQTQRKSALKIQSYIRGYIVRRELKQRYRSVVKIQSAFRAFRSRRVYLNKVKSAVRIQRCYRAYRAMRIQRLAYVQTCRSVRVIQSVFRRWCVKRRMERRHSAATLLQAAFRRYRAQKTYIQLRTEYRQQESAALVIQRCYRNFHTKKRLVERREQRRLYIEKVTVVTRHYIAVVRIQRALRKHRALREAETQLQSVLLIQHWMRGRLERTRYLLMREKVILIQKKARAFLARKHVSVIKVQACVRGWLVRRRWQRIQCGVLRIQTLWRGYRVRRSVTSVKVKAARRRVEAANANATEDKKLGNLTTFALDYLLHCKQLSTILDALIKLDKATRWSHACCELMATSNAAGVIFALIRSCNRSQPHMDIIGYALDVLLNLTKYGKTSSYVLEAENSVSTLIRLLTIYRDKGGAIFTKTCTLLGLLGYPPGRKEVVCAMPQVVEKVRSIYELTLRKYKMDEERNLVKSKMAASKKFSTSMIFREAPQRSLPPIHPEWLLRRESIRDIDNPLRAVKFLLNSLQITPKGSFK